MCESCLRIVPPPVDFIKEYPLKSCIDFQGALFVYTEDNVFARLLHEVKYNFVEEAFEPFTILFDSWYQQNVSFFQNIDVIVAVPLHPRRLAERGFNQSDFIAHMVANKTAQNVEKLLKRSRFTRPQVGLSQPDREKNVKDAFVLSGECTGKSILLVDDVFTTGSTVQSCAKVLKKNGARSVSVFTLARAIK